MPARAMRSEVRWITSLPSTRTEPVRRGTMPMIDFSVVVLPAPLRPSSVTTSPAFTSKLIPCRMWDSPYHASRLRTWRMLPPVADFAGASAIAVSGMTGSQIGFLDAFVLGEFAVMALREHLPSRQHGDDVGEIGHHAQIMLDHEDGVFRRDALDQRRDLVDVLVAHAGHRLVQQHHLRIERERRRDLQRALAPLRHLDRQRVAKLATAGIAQPPPRAIVE